VSRGRFWGGRGVQGFRVEQERGGGEGGGGGELGEEGFVGEGRLGR